MGPSPAGLNELEQVFASVVSTVVGLGFIVLLIMLIFAGFKYLISGGEPKAVAAAHQTTTWALLGLVFMIIAWLVLQLIATFTGVEIIKTFDTKTLCGGSGLPFCTPAPIIH